MELFLTLLLGVVPPAIAYATARFLQALVDGVRTLQPTILLLLALALGSALPLASAFVQSELSRRLRLAMQLEFFDAVNAVPGLGKFEDGAFRDRLAVAQQASESAPAMILRATASSLQGAVSIAGFGFAVARISPPLAGAILAASTIQLAISLRTARDRVDAVWAATPYDRRRHFYASLLVNVQALKEIRLYGLGTFFQDRMSDDLAHENTIESRRSAREARRSSVAVLPMTACGVAGLALLVSSGTPVTVGTASLLIAGVAGLSAALVVFYERIAQLHEYASTYLVYDDLHREMSGLSQASGCVPVPARPQTLEFRDVWFRYGDDQPWALKGVSLQIRAGSPVGLIGHNGAGKSTMMKLLIRFYEPTRGQILVDGIPITNFSVAAWRELIGAVFQDFSCYDLSLYQNIAIGSWRDANPSTVARAAGTIGVDAIAAGWSNGYDTQLSTQFETATGGDQGERKVSLSGGQWQRVALARALMRHDRPVLLLDEPTSGMDAHAEAQVRKAVFAGVDDRLVMYISHRLATLRDCSRILVLDGGRIAESGTHAQLLAAEGLYSTMFTLQSQGYGNVATAQQVS